jgi:rhodanese-related sulfurtransferase
MRKKLLLTSLLAAAVLAAAPQEKKPAAPAGKEIKRAELDSFLAHPEKIFVLDLRSADEIAKIGTLPGYVNIPIEQLEARLAEIPKDKTILPVSNHAVRAWKAQAILEKHGYRVPGGIGVQNYEKEGGKLIFPAKPSAEADPTQKKNWSARGFTGAQKKYWAFQPVNRRTPPAVKDRGWIKTPVDAFILAKLEAQSLAPAPEADRVTLIRRVTLDLTGLLPAPEEVDAFVNDRSPAAYENLIERLLSSPAYGERWARHWLDIARYGDSDGYIADSKRENSWRYRDYVIKAFNEDKPYDRFIREQIAGDEIWPDDPNAFIATGFLRGYQDEFNARDLGLRRQEILNDVTDTTGAAFLGLTFGCARCHDHKFDAIRHEDYYQLQSFFANSIPKDDRPVITGAELAAYQAKKAEWEKATQPIREQIEALVAPLRQKAFDQRLPGFTPDGRDAITKKDSERTPLEKWLYERYKELSRNNMSI